MATTRSTHEKLLASVEATYRLVEKSFDRLLAAATTPSDKEQVRMLYDAARDAYWKAVLARLEDENGLVASILDDLKKANKELKRSLEELQDLVKTLDLLRDAVKLAAALVTLAAA